MEAMRTCCVCGIKTARLKSNRPRREDEPIMPSITPMIYRRGIGKGVTTNAPSIQICEPCLDAIIRHLPTGVPWFCLESSKLCTALLMSIAARYSDLLREDTA